MFAIRAKKVDIVKHLLKIPDVALDVLTKVCTYSLFWMQNVCHKAVLSSHFWAKGNTWMYLLMTVFLLFG